MKRFSRKRFSQVMMSKTLMQELDSLKEIVRSKTKVKHSSSKPDVITFLIKYFKESLRTEYPLNQGLLVVNKLEKNNLNVVTSITPRPYSESVKLDGKNRVSFLLET